MAAPGSLGGSVDAPCGRCWLKAHLHLSLNSIVLSSLRWTAKQDNSFSHEPNLANIRHIRGYCRMGAYIREFIEIFNKGKGKGFSIGILTLQ